MTDEEADALGARLAACPRFKPMPGLRDMQGRTWEQSLLWRWSSSVDRPDIREPATKGIVLALVREAWGYPSAHVQRMFTAGAGWLAYTNDDGDRDHRFYGATEAEALVAALEAAP